jgi:hypothetical protein
MASSYSSLISQAAGYRIALHHERKAHKATRRENRKLIKHLQAQIDNKQDLIETLLERGADLENRVWGLMSKCPALQREHEEEDDDEVEDEVEHEQGEDTTGDEAEDDDEVDDDEYYPAPYYRRH